MIDIGLTHGKITHESVQWEEVVLIALSVVPMLLYTTVNSFQAIRKFVVFYACKVHAIILI